MHTSLDSSGKGTECQLRSEVCYVVVSGIRRAIPCHIGTQAADGLIESNKEIEVSKYHR